MLKEITKMMNQQLREAAMGGGENKSDQIRQLEEQNRKFREGIRKLMDVSRANSQLPY